MTKRESPYTLKELKKADYKIRELATMAQEYIQGFVNDIALEENEKAPKMTVRRQTDQADHLAFATFAQGELQDWVIVFDGEGDEIEPTMEHFFPGYE